MDALKLISESSMKSEVPAFEVGDTVKVHVRIKEGQKYRIQVFEGTVIAKRHGGIQETFTVRRVAHGCGIERVFPVHSPVVDKVEVVRHGKVRRSKLYYLRDRVGKAAKRRTFSNPAAQYLYMMKGIRLLSINLKKQCRVGLFELARSV